MGGKKTVLNGKSPEAFQEKDLYEHFHGWSDTEQEEKEAGTPKKTSPQKSELKRIKERKESPLSKSLFEEDPPFTPEKKKPKSKRKESPLSKSLFGEKAKSASPDPYALESDSEEEIGSLGPKTSAARRKNVTERKKEVKEEESKKNESKTEEDWGEQYHVGD